MWPNLLSGRPVSLKELQLPSIASLRAIAALKSPHLALVRPARIGLGFESAGANQKTLLEVERVLGGPGRLSLPYSLRWLLDVMTGVGVLHRTLGFVHGEVQPEHVVLGEDGVGRLIPVVRAHWVRGEQRAPERLYYLAPEKLLGDRVDVRSDVFSLGVMLWEALAGQRLLEAQEVDDIIARLMGGGIPRVHAPEAEAWTEPLAAIAERAIAVDPGRRFATVAEMKDVLQACCSRYLASPPGMVELFRNPEKRTRSHVRESIAPESQRVTLPPDQTAAGPTKPPPLNGEHEAALEVAAARLSSASYSSIDLEEETTTKPLAAPVPVVSRAKHIQPC
jgi:serine/threonine protein kinase